MVTDVVLSAGASCSAYQNSSRFRWSDTSSATTVDGLAFSNAESSPDYIVGLAIAPGNWSSSGPTSVEFWDLTGNDDEPFQHAGAGPPCADASRVTRSWWPTTASFGSGMTAHLPGQERSRTGEQSRHRGGAEILHEPVVGHGV